MLQTTKYQGCFVYFDGFYSHLKKSENWSPDFICSRAWTWKRGRVNNFPPFFGCTLPPSHSEHQKQFRVGPRIFLKMDPKIPTFRVLSLGSETPSMNFETQIALVFLGLSFHIQLFICVRTFPAFWSYLLLHIFSTERA